MFADDRLAFPPKGPDFVFDFPASRPTWSERWGRRLLGWSAGAALVAIALGTAWWMAEDSQVVTTLALVADQSPASATSGWREPEPEAAAPPPLVMLPVQAVPDPSPPVQAPAEAAPSVLEDNGEEAAQAAAEAVRRAEARRLAARQETAKKEAARKEAARQAKARELARKDAARKEATRLAAARAAAAAEPAAQQAETLRQCRAAGYHAAQCVKRGCVATKFGLACRG